MFSDLVLFHIYLENVGIMLFYVNAQVCNFVVIKKLIVLSFLGLLPSFVGYLERIHSTESRSAFKIMHRVHM